MTRHQPRRDPHDSLAGRDQRRFQSSGHVSAVLQRPDPFVVELGRPTQRREMPRVIGRDLTRSADPAGPVIHRRQSVGALVSVRSVSQVPRRSGKRQRAVCRQSVMR